MFSNGQMIFAILFAIAFVVFIVISYRKDIKRNPKYSKGSIWILVGFLVFVALLMAAKVYLKEQ